MNIEDLPPLEGESWDELKARHRKLTFGKVAKVPALRFKRSWKREYREDLARFPSDPQANVTGPLALRRLVEQRKREGWVPSSRSHADMWDDTTKQEDTGTKAESEAIVRKCLAEAKKQISDEDRPAA